MKLGGVGDHTSAPIASLPIAPALATLFEAFRHRAVVKFAYRGETRELEPWGLSSKRGHWYVVGFDRVRAFRADRIDGDVEVGPGDAFTVPPDFRADDHIEDRAWMLGDAPPVTVRLAVDADHVEGVLGAWAPKRASSRELDRATGRLGRRGHRHQSRRVPQLRARLPRARRDPRPARGARRDDRVARSRRGRCGVSPRPVAGTEVQRILAIVPWIVAHPGASKHEIATRFGMTAEQLDDDLALVLMIGVPPYSPGDYLDVDDDGEFVTIRLADQFSRPLRLTPAEGLALLAAGRTLLAVPGSDPTARSRPRWPSSSTRSISPRSP